MVVLTDSNTTYTKTAWAFKVTTSSDAKKGRPSFFFNLKNYHCLFGYTCIGLPQMKYPSGTCNVLTEQSFFCFLFKRRYFACRFIVQSTYWKPEGLVFFFIHLTSPKTMMHFSFKRSTSLTWVSFTHIVPDRNERA